MPKSLDKYMDNLNSPYWEVYFWIVVIAIGIAGTAVIFIDPMGLAGKFGNAGSFLGGLFTIVAVFIAVIAYKASKNEHKNRVVFDKKQEVEIEILPDLKESLKIEIFFINYQLKTLTQDINSKTSENNGSSLLKLKIRLEINEKYLKRLGSVKYSGSTHYKKLIKLINDVHFYQSLIFKLNELKDPEKGSMVDEINKSEVFVNYIKPDDSNLSKDIFDIKNEKVESLVRDVLTHYFEITEI